MRASLLALGLLVACGGSPPKPPTPPAEPVVPAPEPDGPAPQTPAPQARSFADELRASCDAQLALAAEARAQLVQPGADTLVVTNRLIQHVWEARDAADLMRNVHPDAQVRTAAEDCSKRATEVETQLKLDRAVYDALAAAKVPEGDATARRFRDRLLRDFRLSGVDKSEEARTRLKAIEDELTGLGIRFTKNISEDTRKVRLPAAALAGLPADYVAAHPPDAEGMVTITTDYPDVLPFRAYAKDAAARRKLHIEFQNRGYPANGEVLLQILALRAEKAKLLGFKDWADYITADKMIGSGKNAQAFIDKISRVAAKRARADVAELLAEKRKTEPKAKLVYEDEARYLSEQVRRAKYAFDAQSVRPYFEFSRVRDGLLAITAKLYDVEYRPVRDAQVWHPDVTVYDVFRGAKRLGRIYLDLHPRADKYKHAAQFTLKKGLLDGQVAEAVLVCNFADPRVQKPALMDHDQVDVFFHEFGHLMHDVLGSQQRWITQSGVATEWDFVEAPSQMFEEWAWDPATLAGFAVHVETGKPIDPETVAKMRAADEFGKGTYARGQMFFAALSLKLHQADPKKVDLDRTVATLARQYSPFALVADTHFWSSFGHLNGYSAMYYTYMWSQVIARDLLTPFAAAGLLDPATATRYRTEILEAGGTADAAELVRRFLGRPYRFDAYQKWLNR